MRRTLGLPNSPPLTLEWPLTQVPVSLCTPPRPQFRYKTRVYKQTNLDEKQLAKLHTKVRECDEWPPSATPALPP